MKNFSVIIALFCGFTLGFAYVFCLLFLPFILVMPVGTLKYSTFSSLIIRIRAQKLSRSLNSSRLPFVHQNFTPKFNTLVTYDLCGVLLCQVTLSSLGAPNSFRGCNFLLCNLLFGGETKQ
jgi:hypothetical protein